MEQSAPLTCSVSPSSSVSVQLSILRIHPSLSESCLSRASMTDMFVSQWATMACTLTILWCLAYYSRLVLFVVVDLFLYIQFITNCVRSLSWVWAGPLLSEAWHALVWWQVGLV